MRRFREATDAKKHFLPSGSEIARMRSPRFPGVSDEADAREPEKHPRGKFAGKGKAGGNGDERDDDAEDTKVLDATCEQCHMTTVVRPPDGYEFTEQDDARGEDDKVARWQCACGAPNRLASKVRRVHEAVAAFRSAWRAGDRVPPPRAQDASEAFREVYAPDDEPSLSGVAAIVEFDRLYR